MVEQIKSLCKANGLSIRKFEMMMGIGNGTISKWDRCTPQMPTLLKVADYFNVSLDFLVGRHVEGNVEGEIGRAAKELNQAGIDMLLIFAEGLTHQEQYRKG